MNISDANKDKITAIHEYLIKNRNDREGDSWTLGHNPIIAAHLDTLNDWEAKQLANRVLDWEEMERYHFADPVSDTKNEFIDGIYMYGIIFLSIQDFEKLEYLIQNLSMVVWRSKFKRSLDFYCKILEKANELNKQLDFGYNHLVKILEEKIEKEKADNKV